MKIINSMYSITISPDGTMKIQPASIESPIVRPVQKEENRWVECDLEEYPAVRPIQTEQNRWVECDLENYENKGCYLDSYEYYIIGKIMFVKASIVMGGGSGLRLIEFSLPYSVSSNEDAIVGTIVNDYTKSTGNISLKDNILTAHFSNLEKKSIEKCMLCDIRLEFSINATIKIE